MTLRLSSFILLGIFAAGCNKSNHGNGTVSTPLYAGTVFFGGDSGKFYAVDAISGNVKWIHSGLGSQNTEPDISDSIICTGGNGSCWAYRTYGLDAGSGKELYVLGGVQGNLYTHSTPCIKNGVAYAEGFIPRDATSYEPNVIAFNVHNGSLLWNYTISPSSRSAVTTADNKVFMRDSDAVLALDAFTGARLWETHIGWGTEITPLIVNATLYTQGAPLHLCGFDEQTGSKKWDIEGITLASSPVLGNGYIYCACWQDSSLCAIDTGTHTVKWRTHLPVQEFSSPVVSDSKVVVAATNGNIYCLDGTNGNIIWTAALGGCGVSDPVAADHMLFISVLNSALTSKYAPEDVYGLDLFTGTTKWRRHFISEYYPPTPCVIDAAGMVHHSGTSGAK